LEPTRFVERQRHMTTVRKERTPRGRTVKTYKKSTFYALAAVVALSASACGSSDSDNADVASVGPDITQVIAPVTEALAAGTADFAASTTLPPASTTPATTTATTTTTSTTTTTVPSLDVEIDLAVQDGVPPEVVDDVVAHIGRTAGFVGQASPTFLAVGQTSEFLEAAWQGQTGRPTNHIRGEIDGLAGPGTILVAHCDECVRDDYHEASIASHEYLHVLQFDIGNITWNDFAPTKDPKATHWWMEASAFAIEETLICQLQRWCDSPWTWDEWLAEQDFFIDEFEMFPDQEWPGLAAYAPLSGAQYRYLGNFYSGYQTVAAALVEYTAQVTGGGAETYFTAILNEVGAGASFNNAWQSVYGLPVEDFEDFVDTALQPPSEPA
jgi:hypothetical protein